MGKCPALGCDGHDADMALDAGFRSKDHIVELDGSREGPFDRGHCTDFLTVSAINSS